MPDVQISYCDYSETTAKHRGETIKGLPRRTATIESVGVSVGRAQMYRRAVEDGRVHRVTIEIISLSRYAISQIVPREQSLREAQPTR